ncbi:MAG: cbb3-type cytochrome c oxidase subunit I [Mariprofundaceae bacterium]
MTTKYSIPIADEPQHRLAVGWLYVAVGFLLASGIYPLLLALARTTYEMPWKDFFYTALVLHVDFTVLWWLLAIAGVFWSLNSIAKGISAGWLALALVVAGGVLVGIAPLTGDANPLTNNYVPMLENRMFIKGLLVFGGGVLLLVIRSLYATPMQATFANSGDGALRFGAWTAAIATLVAILALIWSFADTPEGEGRAYYEGLFWAGGHVLQFAHTALMCACWLWLASVCRISIPVSARTIMIMFAMGAVPVLLAPWPFISYDSGGPEFMRWFVWFMRDGNGVAPLLIGLAILWGLLRTAPPEDTPRHLYASLLFSMMLFGLGGVLGLFIGESSTLITAHYHGSIVAVTMAFMAMTYYWLPQFGFATPNLKWAKIQVYAYAIGQLVHIIGLAWGGGHGMKRKVVGTTQDIGIQAFVTPQDLVGIGGVVAVLSGILFAIVVLPVMFRGKSREVKTDA